MIDLRNVPYRETPLVPAVRLQGYLLFRVLDSGLPSGGVWLVGGRGGQHIRPGPTTRFFLYTFLCCLSETECFCSCFRVWDNRKQNVFVLFFEFEIIRNNMFLFLFSGGRSSETVCFCYCFRVWDHRKLYVFVLVFGCEIIGNSMFLFLFACLRKANFWSVGMIKLDSKRILSFAGISNFEQESRLKKFIFCCEEKN
jgi:hypothetical protein